MSEQLVQVERERLARNEGIIQRGIAAFKEVGTALAAIRDGRLYRETHATFEAYCSERWQLTRPRAYELMAAAEAVSEFSDTEGPAVESHARELGRVSEEDRADVWQQANDRTSGKPTARAIREVRQEREQPDPDPEPEDPEPVHEPVPPTVGGPEPATDPEPEPARIPSEDQLLDAIEQRQPGAKAEVGRVKLSSRFTKAVAGTADLPLMDPEQVVASVSESELGAAIGVIRNAAKWADQLEAARQPRLRAVAGGEQ